MITLDVVLWGQFERAGLEVAVVEKGAAGGVKELLFPLGGRPLQGAQARRRPWCCIRNVVKTAHSGKGRFISANAGVQGPRFAKYNCCHSGSAVRGPPHREVLTADPKQGARMCPPFTKICRTTLQHWHIFLAAPCRPER